MERKQQTLKQKVLEYYPDADLSHIDTAYELAKKLYGSDNIDGFSHAFNVADELAGMRMDVETIAAALLHDLAESRLISSQTIKETFGNEMFVLLDGVAQLNTITNRDNRNKQAENLRRMFLAIADDIRVIFIKLVDRIYTMRNLENRKKKQRQSYAQETMDIYAPIASRLGIYTIKKELEDLSFQYLFPNKYAMINKLIRTGRQDRESYVTRVKNILHKKMAKANIKCHILGRHKHCFSIYQKMIQQHLPFEEIYDIIAFRIILDTIPQCYEVLGIIHKNWKPIPNKIKDYIAAPKPNMYRALHTTVYGPGNKRIEIQIRTWEMDRVAKTGVAAHWSYKEGKSLDKQTQNTFAWIQQLIEDHKNYTDPDEFLENVKIDLYPDDVYVFTPNGDVISLPQGATPLDFAYAIHSEVGNRCIGAKVNGVMRPLKYQLKTGDHVEILTSKKQHPGKNWLNIVKTVKARSRIRQWIKQQEHENSLSMGRELCEHEFTKNKLSFNKELKSDVFERIKEEFKYKTVDDLIAAVGYGKVTPRQIINYFIPHENKQSKGGPVKRMIQKFKRRSKSGIRVNGMGDILIRLGKCCNPLPGDDIIGYITRGHGVTVHKASCINTLKVSPERYIDVEWDTDKSNSFNVEVSVLVSDRMGLLADISAEISRHDSNIASANTTTFLEGYIENRFVISVHDTRHLKRIFKALHKIKNVKEVRRVN
ncbi:MAG: GTP pyrophosphokinase [Candidatus Magnetoglobus multicellularis str. Araruama]|uniref:GTP pyrophosphokinase n=1 Tax=Candidatus Magnetoglobus multicellularis str. Araruama TaxID=890399 RepID=A0A1V1P7W4_9BACT|nr:MAG: GTP pyrophosphokinase [Candidatus Magnetoglobus multicellularis str. Araruama]